MSSRHRSRYPDTQMQGEQSVQRQGTPGARSRVAAAYRDRRPDGASVVQRKIAQPTAVQLVEGAGGGGGARIEMERGEGGAEGASGADPAAESKGAADDKVARLYLLVDIDVKELGIKDLMNGSVGHTWISIEYMDPRAVPATVPADHRGLLAGGGRYADPMGFWPDIQNNVYYSTNPFKSWVKGWMRHPDRAHQGAEKAVQVWEITQAEVDAVIAYAESKRGANYSVYFFNCTSFAREATQAAGKSAPSMSTGGICFPNAAYDGIKARQQKGQGHTMVTDLDTDATTEVRGSDSKKSG